MYIYVLTLLLVIIRFYERIFYAKIGTFFKNRIIGEKKHNLSEPIINTPAAPPMNCMAALFPPRNGTISGHSVPAIPGTQVIFQCDDALLPEGIMTTTCLATGEWDKNPEEIVCRGMYNLIY